MKAKVARFLSIASLLAYSLNPAISFAEVRPDRSELKTLTAVSNRAKGLSIHLKGADLLIRHEERGDIELKSNYPEHWQIGSEGEVRQNQASVCPAGLFTNANGKMVMRGHTIQVKGDRAIIDGKEFDTIPDTAPIRSSAGRSSLSISPNGILVNGKKLREGPVDENNPDRPEVLQVILPKTFEGNLSIDSDMPTMVNGIQSDSVKIDEWSGPLAIKGKNAEVELGCLKSQQKATVSIQSKNSLRIKQVESNEADFSTDGEGASIDIERLEAEAVDLKAINFSRIEIRSGSTHRLKTESIESRITLAASFQTENLVQKTQTP